ncbi:MAG: Lrp/AsnC family transcriptional regulator [Clostridiales bacterium]|nr:Lrp/AsnC family transcriptional regulator [Clostridiales bacterium]
MDHIDSEILQLLQKNARISLSEISSHVNLSVSAVSERLKKLEQSELILRYTTILNPLSFGKHLEVYVILLLDPGFDAAAMEAFTAQEPDILEYHCFAGGSDALIKIYTEGTASLNSILGRLRRLPGIGRLVVHIVTGSPKNDPSVKPIS